MSQAIPPDVQLDNELEVPKRQCCQSLFFGLHVGDEWSEDDHDNRGPAIESVRG